MTIFAHIFQTEYSLNEGYGKPSAFIAEIKKQSLESGEEPCLIIADKFSMSGHIPFYKDCQKEGVKAVFGVTVKIQGENGEPDYNLILVAKDEAGRQNINEIITFAYKVTEDKGYKIIKLEQLLPFTEGLMAISGGYKTGLVEKAILNDDADLALSLTEKFTKIFDGDFYLNAQRTSNDMNEQTLENKVIDGLEVIKNKIGTKIIATNDVRFPKKSNYELHLAKQAIIDGKLLYDPSRKLSETPSQYLLPTMHMAELFKDHIEYVLEAGALADRTDTSYFKNLLGKPHLPQFPIPEGFADDPNVPEAVKYLTHITRDLFEVRWKKIEDDYKGRIGEIAYQDFVISEDFIKNEKKKYESRLEFELDVIAKTGFAGYFLIVHELIAWSRENDIPVGPGRGSGAGSLVLYSLSITNIDPIPHDLLFERFLNPERMSEPDIDMDFSPENRGRVIQHLKDLYGHDRTAQILTEGTMAARSVIDYVGKIKGLLPYERDKIKNLISEDLGTTLKGEMQNNDKLIALYNSSNLVKNLVDTAIEEEGALISFGMHAGGVVIAPGRPAQYTGMYQDETKQEAVIQLNKNTCEYAGLIKFDILGLKNLDIIDSAVKDINEGRTPEDKLDMSLISLKDEKTIDIFKRADTYGIFQFESLGMRNLMKKLSPDRFDEIVALVALFRPGPLQSKMDEDFINRKFNAGSIKYPHPKLTKTLGPTFGTIIYQEQVMSIAQVLAGYTLGQADILRKAMGKKDQKIMDEQRIKFCIGCVEHTARVETLENTTKNMGMGLDIVFENTENNFIKELTKDTDNKIATYEQVGKILSYYCGYTEQQIEDLAKDINDVKLDDLKFGYFYKHHGQELLKSAKSKLKEDGVSDANLEKEAQRLVVASSVFVKYNGIFSLMNKFAAYGFNKSHSVAYAAVSFETAYLKAHYPAQYMSAMATKQDNIEKLTVNLAEIRRMGLNILSPDVNESGIAFKAISNRSDEDTLRYGLGQIKGINKSVEHLVKIRAEKGKTLDIFDFYDKYGTYVIKEEKEQLDGSMKESKKTLMTKTVLSNLLNAGALDSICPNKDPKHRTLLHSTFMYLEDVVKDVKKRLKANSSDIVKKLKIHYGNKEYLNVLKKVTLSDDPESVLMPENITKIDADNLKKIYAEFEDIINPRASKKTEMLTIKPIEAFTEELKLFNPTIKTLDIDGHIYIVPDSKNYADVPEFGSKDQLSKELSLTGMYQSSNPTNQEDVSLAKMALQFMPISNSDLNQYIKKEGNLRGKNQVKYADVNVAGIVVAVDDKRSANKNGDVFTNVRVRLDDGTDTVTVQFKAEEVFISGKELRGVDLIKSMIGKDVLFVSGSAKEPAYDSAEVVVYPNRIGSTNQSIYLPVDDASLNYKADLHERSIKSLATDNQIEEIKKYFKKYDINFDDFIAKNKTVSMDGISKVLASQVLVEMKQNEDRELKNIANEAGITTIVPVTVTVKVTAGKKDELKEFADNLNEKEIRSYLEKGNISEKDFLEKHKLESLGLIPENLKVQLIAEILQNHKLSNKNKPFG